MAKSYHIELEAGDLGQLLDGLEMRAESWERTAEYLRSGNVDGDYVVEECSKPEEADCITARSSSTFASRWRHSDQRPHARRTSEGLLHFHQHVVPRAGAACERARPIRRL